MAGGKDLLNSLDIHLSESEQHLNQELDFVFDRLNSDLGSGSDMSILVLKYLHVLQLVVFLQLIQFAIVLLEQIEELFVVLFTLFNIGISSSQSILK